TVPPAGPKVSADRPGGRPSVRPCGRVGRPGHNEVKSAARLAAPTRKSRAMSIKSCRDFGYEADDHWAKLPAGWGWTEAVAVAVDSRGRVFVFNRGAHPVIVFGRDGGFLASWGEGLFGRPHGLSIGPDDSVYCTDDFGHVVRKFTPEGKLLLTL